MHPINLSDQDQQLLIDLLDREIPNLREEIHYTDEHEYRERLKEKEAAIKNLLTKLKEGDK